MRRRLLALLLALCLAAVAPLPLARAEEPAGKSSASVRSAHSAGEVADVWVRFRDSWMSDWEFDMWIVGSYGFMDLEGDGFPEMFVSFNEKGNSYNTYFRYDPEADRVVQIDTDDEAALCADLSKDIEVYLDPASGRLLYLCLDTFGVHEAGSSASASFLLLDRSGRWVSRALWDEEVRWEARTYEEYRHDYILNEYEDILADGASGVQRSADSEAWAQYQREFLAQFRKTSAQIRTIDTDYNTADDETLRRALIEMYNAFYCGGWELGIYAFGTTTLFDTDRGHAFLTLRNTRPVETLNLLNYPVRPGEEITLGYWSSYKLSINHDAVGDARNKDGSHEVVSLRKMLATEEELQRLIDFTVAYSGTEYDGLTNNCTTYAVEAWNLVNGDKPIRDTSIFNRFGDVDAPKWTREYIEQNYGGEGLTIAQYASDETLTRADVFYVQPNGTIFPDYPQLTGFTAAVDPLNAPCDIEIHWKKKGKVLCDGSILTNYVTVECREKDGEEAPVVEEVYEVGPGGCTLTGLKPATTYLVRLRPRYIFTNAVNGELVYMDGSWLQAIEVKTGGDTIPVLVFQ